MASFFLNHKKIVQPLGASSPDPFIIRRLEAAPPDYACDTFELHITHHVSRFTYFVENFSIFGSSSTTLAKS